ncbi:MAG: response regulator transcription factor [Tissierellales bacterium]|jgi:DNA-binding response OmpR family regulator|nr:response regulator transcription factor [Tissierellales bacterium]
MDKKVLIIEDQRYLLEVIEDYFTLENYKVIKAINGKQALEIFDISDVDLVILDIMLPKINGWTVCEKIRSKSDVPIIMLTALSEDEDKIKGFDLGADEYVVKPFSPKVLLARAKNLLKRVDCELGPAKGVINRAGIIIDQSAYRVTIDSKEVELANKEYALLNLLIENENQVLSREQILDRVWGIDYFGNIRVVDTHIKKLRKKLGDRGGAIKTIVRVGYKFEVMK